MGPEGEPWLVRQVLAAVPRVAPRSASERAAFESLLRSLASTTRKHLPSYSPQELAETVFSLGQLGQLDPEFMDEVLRLAGEPSRRGDMRGLADLLGAMASVK